MMPEMNAAVFAVSSSPLVSALVKVTVTAALGLIGARLARGSRAAVRHALLAAAFGVTLLLPIASVVVPPVHLGIPVAVENRAFTAAPVVSGVEQISSDVVADGPGDRAISAPHSISLS